MTLETEEKEFNKLLMDPSTREAIDGLVQCTGPNVMGKSSSVSERARREGNAFFVKSFHTSAEHEEIFKLYCKSVATAPIKSEDLALAYGNRSAFLFHIGKFEDCVSDIDKAIEITLSNLLKVKLLCRKLKCFSALGNSEDMSTSLNKTIMTLIESISDKKIQESLLSLLKEARAHSVTEKLSNDQTASTKSNKMTMTKVLEEKVGVIDSIKLKFNKKYGNHLVANQDIEPGEIIFVEKFYSAYVDKEKKHTNCENCFTACWSGIPCNNCAWAMFCSEECKQEAMKNYHDIECFITPYMMAMVLAMPEWDDRMLLLGHCIRLLVLALKEFGSIEKLMMEVEAINKLDSSKREQYLRTNGIKASFATIYHLEKSFREELQPEALGAACALTVISKYTPVLGKNIHKVEDLLQNKDLFFIGVLMIKFMKITTRPLGDVPKKADDIKLKKFLTTAGIKGITGLGLSICTNLISHSCVSNVQRCVAKNKIIIVAVLPIKKNSQLFYSYVGNYFDSSRTQRHKALKSRFYTTCSCAACMNDWGHKPQEVWLDKVPTELKYFKLIDKWEPLVYSKSVENNFLIIQELSEIVKQAIQDLSPASDNIGRLKLMLGHILRKVHGNQPTTMENCIGRK